jgi:hypothetical protein
VRQNQVRRYVRTRHADRDREIWRLRVVEMRPWRDVGAQVGLSHTEARRQFYTMVARVEPADVVAMREEESAKLDEREAAAWAMMRAAMELGGFDTAIKALAQLDRIGRSRAALFGLDTPVVQKLQIDLNDARARVDEAVSAYLAGVADAAH